MSTVPPSEFVRLSDYVAPLPTQQSWTQQSAPLSSFEFQRVEWGLRCPSVKTMTDSHFLVVSQMTRLGRVLPTVVRHRPDNNGYLNEI